MEACFENAINTSIYDCKNPEEIQYMAKEKNNPVQVRFLMQCCWTTRNTSYQKCQTNKRE